MLIYLDTNIVVYLVERPLDLGSRATALITELKARGDQFAISHVVRMECKVKPLASRDHHQLGAYDAFFAGGALLTLELTGEVFDRAAEIRAFHSLRALDALHLAAALVGGCEAFLTNDARLSSFPDLRVMLLS